MLTLVDEELSATAMPTIRMTIATHHESTTLQKKTPNIGVVPFCFRDKNVPFKSIDKGRIDKVDFLWANRIKT